MAIETSGTQHHGGGGPPQDGGALPQDGTGSNSAHRPAAGAVLDEFRYDDKIVRWFAGATVLWGLIATLIGLVVAILLVTPKLFWPLGDASQYLTFARLRPLHTSMALFAFAGNAVFAAVYYSTQRLCKTRMWSTALSWLHFWGWQAIILSTVTLPLGITQGRELAELEWPIDLAMAVVWILLFGVNFFATLARRRERHLYVTLWFYIATIVTIALLLVFNSLSLAIDTWKSYPLYAGVQDAMMQWWYGHNLLAFLLVMPFLGLMYYFLPKAAEQPVFSYKLAVIHFWGLLVFHILAGPHHLHHTPAPEWATTLGMLSGLLLWMPAWGGAWNGLMTLRAARPRDAADPVLKFFWAALIFYGWYALDRTLLSIKSVSSLAHYSDWTIANVHAAALGWAGMMTFGMLYWLLPRLFQTKLWSSRMAGWHFWVALLGVLLYIVPIYAAGIMQGWRWMALETGRLAYPSFLETVQASVPFWWARAAGGALYIAGLLMMAVNHVMTWASRPAQYQVPLQTATPLSAQSEPVEATEPPSRLQEAPVLQFARGLDIWSRLHWHRRWERTPGKFTFLVVVLVVLASLLELGPAVLIRSEVPASTAAAPYTPLELAGRDIYLAEGCYHCHSQTVRPLVAETARYGEYSKPHEFAYDRPVQWGSRRIGPDLAREGGKQTSLWHWLHLEDPQQFAAASVLPSDPQQAAPQSVMPSFEHLLRTAIDYDKIYERVWAAQRLGAEYPEYDFRPEEVPDEAADAAGADQADAERADAEGEQAEDAADADAPPSAQQQLKQQIAADARQQAERIAADIVSQGGPVLVQRLGQEPLLVIDTQAVALIAYLQRLGVDVAEPPQSGEAPAAGDASQTDPEQSSGDEAAEAGGASQDG